MSTYDNKFLMYFKGHKSKVLGLDISPNDDRFISFCKSSLRLWDLASSKPLGVLKMNAIQCAAFDKAGFIFAVGVDSNQIHLYDLKTFTSGPFSSFRINLKVGIWHKMEFSNDGKFILISTNDSHLVIDAFKGNVVHRLSGHNNSSKISFTAIFTPDSQFILSGAFDGSIRIYDVVTGKSTGKLDFHSSPPRVLAFNPVYLLLASADNNLVIWSDVGSLDSRSVAGCIIIFMLSTTTFVLKLK